MPRQDYVAKLNADIEKHLENLYQAPGRSLMASGALSSLVCLSKVARGSGRHGPSVHTELFRHMAQCS